MKSPFIRVSILLMALAVVIGVFTVDAQQKRKPSRRKTHPVASPTPSPGADGLDAKIVSTADGTAGVVKQGTSNSAGPKALNSGVAPANDPDGVRKQVENLANQVNSLTVKLSRIEEDQLAVANLERLSRAEQRAEELRSQLRDVQSKQLDYQARMEQIDIESRPENVDSSISMVGTLHPEEVRAQRRAALESEKRRVQAQLDLLDRSRLKLESAIATADTEVEKLQAKVDAPDENANPKPDTKVDTKADAKSDSKNNNDNSVPIP